MLRGHYRGRVKPQEEVLAKTRAGDRRRPCWQRGEPTASARGWKIDIIDSAERPGRGASGSLAGVLRPLQSLDDNRLARLTRRAACTAAATSEALAASGCAATRWDACGVLHLARDPRTKRGGGKMVERSNRRPNICAS